MDQLSLVPVVLCGGAGTRLWPLSRESMPKQFLRLHGEHSLLQQTLLRCAALKPSAPLLLAAEATRFIAAAQLKEIGVSDATLLLEPMQRGTAAAIASAAFHLLGQHEDALMLVLPSDHLLRDSAAFTEAVQTAAVAARTGMLLTFGVAPSAPETGYGYLQAGAELASGARQVDAFIEKPDSEHAEYLIASRQYLWNSGMFLFRCRSLVEEMAQHAPQVCSAAEQAVRQARTADGFVRLDAAAFADSPDISIDHAVMERTRNAALVTLNAGWSDIGSWSSVWESAPHDSSGNATRGDVMLEDCHNCHVHAGRRLVSACGLDGLVIVDTDDALLVLPKDQAQRTRDLVQRLRHADRPEYRSHREVARPWGSYDAIANGPRFQVKRITVRPGASLSLQMHHHRAEHWIVVSGTARVTDGDKTYLLTENQSTYIGVGVVHSLANPGKMPLELIEVQSGSYLGEDDIVRLSDPYGRS